MSRFYVPKEYISGDKISIDGKEAHHILNVMRLKVSDKVIVFDGTGKEYVGLVRETGRKSLLLEVIKVRSANPQLKHNVTLIQAIPKKEKMDYIVEKATELGVSSIIPMTTARTIPDWNEAKKSIIVARWQKISREAAKQSGRLDLPEIKPIAAFDETIKDLDGVSLKLIAALSDKAVKLKDAFKNCSTGRIVVAIGPEGDFTSEEISIAEEKDFKVISLGPRVLKSDTAGLALLAIINYEYQD